MKKLKTRTFSGTTNAALSEREKLGMDIAREAAAAGIVLLKNENNILPIAKGSKIALYGIGAANTFKGGTGSGDVNERQSVSIFEGLKNAGYIITNEAQAKESVEFYKKAREAWRDDILKKCEGKDGAEFFIIYSTNPFSVPENKQSITKTDTDTAIYVVSRVAGEGADRHNKKGDFLLTEAEEKELDSICSLYEKVVVVLNTGGVMDLSPLDKYPNIYGIINLGQAGMEGGNALSDIVSGEVNPSGKLAASWAFKYEDYPNASEFSHNNGNVNQEYYNEGIYVGYRYFDSFNIPVRYGFGFGLSYTDFSVEFEGIKEEKGKGVILDVRVKNTGKVAGREVIQVYVSCPEGKLEKERRRLAAFKKTELLAAGEEKDYSLAIPFDVLTSYNEDEPGWMLEKGLYGFYVGNSLGSSVLKAIMELDADVITEKTMHICKPEKPVEEYKVNSKLVEERKTEIKKLAETLPVVRIKAESIAVKETKYLSNEELAAAEEIELVKSLSEEQIKKLATGDPGRAQEESALGSAGISVPGSASETSHCAENKGIAGIVLADGPAGLRLNRYYFVRDGKMVPMSFMFSLEGGLLVPDADKTEGERFYQYCTAFPVGTVLAQTWDEEVVRKVGQHVAKEMVEFGVTLWLAPGMNIQRNPLCGRNFEYYSEDPFITGKIAAAMTGGVQSVKGCGTTVKHFACNNNEDNRMGCDSILSERALREIYLKGFGIAIKEAQPMSIMTSYNKINGIHAANNYDLCTNVARNEFGFKGMIMTDWTTTHNGTDCTAAGCIRAGNDAVMPGCEDDQINLTEELASGKLQKTALEACVSRLVRCVLQSNEYEEA
ncbi:glycosyl hydrolase family 3 protein [Catonella morbi ATCC 51271]|uniref:Glycosyl hydrolase family 3 protein n=1 Tax=Catonella morbi ATCC 51271 TaxID=592026 RepID=V2XJ82_9FIRM|nr:glycoside hydrolase family 3 protein [Catonella morbi]ESL02209.1 glycosyl hydrolase family 3 protein [Catonella morbi ATCC 51271]